MDQQDFDLQQQQEQEQARDKEAERHAAMRGQHLDQIKAEQARGQEPEPEHKSLADTPAPELPQPETQRGGMERELRLDTGLRQETAQWSMDGFKLAGEQQAAGMTPFARSLADEPAPDLSAVERQPEQQERQIEQEHQREQER